MENFLKINKRVYPSIWDLQKIEAIPEYMNFSLEECGQKSLTQINPNIRP